MAYLTVGELRSHLGVRPEFVEDDAQLAVAIGAADAAINDYCGRTFEVDSTPTVRIYPAPTGTVLHVSDVSDPDGTVIVETSTDRVTWTVWAGTWFMGTEFPDWPGVRLHFLDSMPSGWVRITALHGWATVPDPVGFAARLISSQLAARKQSPNGIEGFAEFGAVRASRYLDAHALQLLAIYRKADAFMGVG